MKLHQKILAVRLFALLASAALTYVTLASLVAAA